MRCTAFHQLFPCVAASRLRLSHPSAAPHHASASTRGDIAGTPQNSCRRPRASCHFLELLPWPVAPDMALSRTFTAKSQLASCTTTCIKNVDRSHLRSPTTTSHCGRSAPCSTPAGARATCQPFALRHRIRGNIVADLHPCDLVITGHVFYTASLIKLLSSASSKRLISRTPPPGRYSTPL